jgi:hypothetical protein
MSVMTKEGFGALKFPLLVLAAGLGLAAFLVAISYLFWQSDKASNVQSQRRLGEAKLRLAKAEQERNDLRNTEDTYAAITKRGVFIPENRLDLLDAMEALRQRHGITSLEYQVGAQRPLKLAGDTSISAVDVLGSRIVFKATALHDGDMLAFLDEFSRMQRGLFPIERCALGRNDKAGLAVVAPPTSAVGDGSQVSVRPTALTSAIAAECALEWITLSDKRASTPATPSATPTKAK